MQHFIRPLKNIISEMDINIIFKGIEVSTVYSICSQYMFTVFDHLYRENITVEPLCNNLEIRSSVALTCNDIDLVMTLTCNYLDLGTIAGASRDAHGVPERADQVVEGGQPQDQRGLHQVEEEVPHLRRLLLQPAQGAGARGRGLQEKSPHCTTNRGKWYISISVLHRYVKLYLTCWKKNKK